MTTPQGPPAGSPAGSTPPPEAWPGSTGAPTQPRPPTQSAAPTPAGGPRYGVRRLIVAGAVLLVIAVVVIIVIATRGDDSSTAKSTTTTLSVRNVSPPSAAVAALNFKQFTNATPAFSVFTPGAAKQVATSPNVRFGPAQDSSVKWTLDVLPAAPGVDLKSELTVVSGSKGGTATPMADSGSLGRHLDEMITTKSGVTYVHVVAGTNNVFVLSVPQNSGGNSVNGKAIFNQMTGSLRAAGIG